MPLIICPQCQISVNKSPSAIGRAARDACPIYCGRICAGIGRRKGKTKEQLTEQKRQYDIGYRAKNRALLKVKKAAYFQKTYDPEKAAIYRQLRMPKHVEYCRSPQYRQWKHDYDQVYLAKRNFGEFWESALLARDIRNECLSRMTDYEIRLEKGTLGKSQQRKRDYERTISKEPQSSPLGNLEQHQRR